MIADILALVIQGTMLRYWRSYPVLLRLWIIVVKHRKLYMMLSLLILLYV